MDVFNVHCYILSNYMYDNTYHTNILYDISMISLFASITLLSFSVLQCMYMYNVCCTCTYGKFHNAGKI